MRDLIVTLVIVGLFPACFRRPFVGLCVFSWLAYMRVQDLTWGFARDVRWSYYVAILTFAGFLLQRARQRWFLPDPRSYVMLALVALVGIGIAVSEDPSARQLQRYMEFVKIVGVALFTTAIVRTREQLRILVWIIALSLGFFGVKSGIWGIFTLGRVPILRGPGGMLGDNNDFSLALSMAVPMLFHLGWTERRPEIKRAFWIAVPLTVVTVGLTRSRGGFLSVITAIGMLIWRSRNRLTGILIGLLIASAALVVAPEDYIDRLKTLRNPTEEGSAAGRLRAWRIATRMAADNPWLGVGLWKFRAHYLDYEPDPTPAELAGDTIVAHSSYFQIWAECGTPAFALYLFLIFSSLWTCWKVRRMARARYFSSWIMNYATMFEASVVTFMVGASFLNRGHFDLFYHLVALIMVFGHIAMREMRGEAREPVQGGVRAPVLSEPRPGFGPQPSRGAFPVSV
jgi:probable O-glycosylation ligase (exosortase A-associated)